MHWLFPTSYKKKKMMELNFKNGSTENRKNCQKWLSHFINVSICVAKTLSEERLGHKLLFQNRN